MTKPSRTADPDEALDATAQGTAPMSDDDGDAAISEIDAIGAKAGIAVSDRQPLADADPIAKRDAHRWELDPASAEDAKDRTP